MNATVVSTHTPGPWSHVNGNEIHDKAARYDNAGTRIGDTPNRIAVIEYPYADPEGQDANARLIAAAPEMLTALRRLVACPDVNADMLSPETIVAADLARDAIRHAEGSPIVEGR